MVTAEFCSEPLFWQINTVTSNSWKTNLQFITFRTHRFNVNRLAWLLRLRDDWFRREVEWNSENVSVFHIEQAFFVQVVGLATQGTANNLLAEELGAKSSDAKDVRNRVGIPAFRQHGDGDHTTHLLAGAIKSDSPAGQYLRENGVALSDFNSYGSRRGNHEIMMRGTFANIRLRNLLAPGTEGGVTIHVPTAKPMSIYDAAMAYQADDVAAIVIAGKEYGSGSSRDWAAKGPALLGIRAAIAESYERIHRSNLVGMGILPLQFVAGDSPKSLGLTGHELFNITGVCDGAREVTVTADDKTFTAIVRIDTPKEWEYYRHGGILHYVLRQLAAK